MPSPADSFTLALSAGYFGLYAHTGVVLALEDEERIPTRITGSSSGALIAALFAAGLDGTAIAEACGRLRRQDFWDPRPGFGLLKGDRFRRLLRDLLPVQRIEDCRIPLAISVYVLRRRRTCVLEHGPLVDAVFASCAVPFLFHPARLEIEGERRTCIDGGLRDRAALASRRPQEHVLLHWLPSRRPDRRAPPADARLEVYSIDGLPRVSPFRLHEGPRALEHAYDSTRAWLGARSLERSVSAGAAD